MRVLHRSEATEIQTTYITFSNENGNTESEVKGEDRHRRGHGVFE
jgi:hypothetical protein